MPFCLPKSLTNEFLKKIKSGEVDPEKLSNMTSQERRSFFTSFLGEENARQVNALFESKLLLKNQQQGIINWAKRVGGLKPQVQRDILSRVEKMTEILQPKEMDAFLEDLAAQKLGVSVTMEEAGRIAELSKVVSDKKALMRDDFTFPTEESRLDYGRAKVSFLNYVSDLKSTVKKPITSGRIVSETASLAKSLKATLDNSVLMRQGLKTIFSEHKIWRRNAIKSFHDIWNTFRGKDVMNEVRADVLSRPNALNGLYKKEKLAVGVMEEEFPTRLPEKVPVLGRAFKAAENAFTAFQYRTRADIFDKTVDIIQKSGGDITGVGRYSNTLTGRGDLGRLEPVADVVNNIFFSPRFLKSHVDFLTAHAFDPNMSPDLKKRAAANLLKTLSGIAAILAIAKIVSPGSVQEDARSSDFGKIRVKDTRFDVSGGMASLVTLATRILRGSTKSSITGKIRKLNEQKYGATTTSDLVYNFFENKLSPASRAVLDILNGTTFEGERVTPFTIGGDLFVPMPIETYLEAKKNPNSANGVLIQLMEAVGIGVNTYSRRKR